MYPYTLPLLLLALLMGGSGQASNLMREQRIAAEITRGPVGGELLWLQAGQTRFLAIHSPATTRKTLGGVILLHDMGGHPDRAEVIRPLRLYLPTRGWDCLSIQLPVAARGADAQAYRPLIPQAAARIQAAIDYFKGRNDRNLILLGHGLGARMALESLARRQPKEVRALVAIGLPTPPRQADNPVTRAMARLQIPMLDLFGEFDLEPVTRGAGVRRRAARRADLDYRQVRVAGADHSFSALQRALQLRVAAWLKRVAGREITGPRPSTD